MADTKRNSTLPAKETALFCEQISLVLKAGIPLYEGMETLAASYGTGKFGAQFTQMRDVVLNSGSLADAVEQAGIFPTYLTGMVRIGERAGKLDEVMSSLAAYYYWEADVKSSIRNAILYPAILVLMLTVVIAILIVNVLPVFNQVFAGLGITDASTSGAAMRTGMGIGTAVLIVIGVVLLALIVILLLLQSRRRDQVFNWVCRVIPPIGAASEKLSTGRFCSVLSVMLAAGCSFESAMDVVPFVITDSRYKARVSEAAARIDEGTPISVALTDANLFSGMYAKMVRFGGAAGQLDNVFEKLRETYMREADDSISALVSMIEPVLVTVLSVVIGGILLTVMLPLLSVLSAIG